MNTNRDRRRPVWTTGLAAIALAALLVSACGGSGESARQDPRDGVSAPVVEIRSSNAQVFQASFAFGHPRMTAFVDGGETWTQVDIPGLSPDGAEGGHPGLPVLRQLLAVPMGARVQVDEVRAIEVETLSLRLAPFQPHRGDFSPAYDTGDPTTREDEIWTPPFDMDATAYAQDTWYPEATCGVGDCGPARYARLVVLSIAGGRYNPLTGQLVLFSSVEVDLSFPGSTGEFVPPQARNPFDSIQLHSLDTVVNHEAAWENVHFEMPNLTCNGEELLILTAPEYRPAADRLAAWKSSIGVPTTVVTVNDATGASPDTKEEIKAFILDRFQSCEVVPSYLLLFGDSDDIEPWVLPRRYKPGEFPSDFPYGQIGTDVMAYDLTSDIAVGRIPVNSLAQAETVVDKIIGYESMPPAPTAEHPFYSKVGIAAYFQCCDPGPPSGVEDLRRFVQDAEEIRGHLNLYGYDVDRIYTTEAPDPAEYPLDPTPRFYTDGVTPLPAPLRPQDGFAWDGDTQDVVDAFNEGRVLFWHSDHGGGHGWGHPPFQTAHLPLLANGDLLPVVVSGNCSSGAYDLSYDGFAESILRMSGGGAVGVFAFTRGTNNAILLRTNRGLIDALFPGTYPELGGTTVRSRLGDMLLHAQMRIVLAQGTPPDYGTWCYVRMLSLFGDPTLAVWRNNPYQLPLHFTDIVDGPVIDLGYPLEGAVITALEPMGGGLQVPIGRGVVRNGRALLPAIREPTTPARVQYFAAAVDGIARPITQAPVAPSPAPSSR